MKLLLIAALIVLPVAAACGGGGDDGGGKKTNAASTAAMAQSFTVELTKMKQCIQDEIDGKAQCGGNLLSADPVSNLCNDVRTGRAIHASSKVDLDKPRPEYSLEVVQLDPENGAWILDRPPLMPSTRCDTEEEWRVRIDQARTTFGRPT